MSAERSEREPEASPGPALLWAALVGSACGALWTVAHTPPIHSLGLLVATHAVAGLALVGIARLLPRWRGPGSAILAPIGAFVLGPLMVAPLGSLGGLAGAAGATWIVAGIGVGALVGLELGRHFVLGGVVTALLVGAVFAADAQLGAERTSRPPVQARSVVADFPDQRVAILGIDGGDLQVIRPLWARGELPNLRALADRGRHGVLRALEPTLSPVAWTTLLSGHLPETHGLRSWHTSDNRNRRVPMIWDVFGAHGLRSVVVNVPGTWPPADVEEGIVLAGFPIPSIASGDRNQLLGAVLSSVPGEAGEVATHPLERVAPGRYRGRLPVATHPASLRVPGVTHPLLDALVKEKILAPPRVELAFEAVVGEGGTVRIEAPLLDGPVELAIDAPPPWIPVETPHGRAHLRMAALEATPERLRLYATPAFQDPAAPRFGYTSGIEPSSVDAGAAPYVVEGVGWRAHRDDRVAALLPDLAFDLERAHAAAALDLIADPPDLLVYTITVTDRIQHPFWRLHDPAPYGEAAAPHPGLDARDPVVEAYRLADRIVGRILAALPDDTLVFVVSDHGAAPLVDRGEGGHRLEGVWIAAGPGVTPSAGPLELGMASLVPTLFHCLGAPASAEWPGEAEPGVCPGRSPIAPVAAYRGDVEEAPLAAERIDESREAQLRALGYIE